jgi:hypothetical protein
MSCEHYKQDLIEAAATGDALPNEARSHAEGCTRCSAALAEEQTLFAAIDASLRHNSDTEPSPSFLARVRAAVETEPVSGRKHQFALGWALVATATLVVLGISLAQSFRGEKQPRIKSTTASVQVAPAIGNDAPRESAVTTKNDSFTKKSYRAGTDTSTSSRSRAASVSIARNSAPEVFVPAGQYDLLLRYLEGLNAANSMPAFTPSLAHQVNVTHAEIPPIEISELVIKPLSGPDTD